ncbi:MAG: hypothetical protein OEU95_06695 [Nitrospirota bacterium]|nr:hypothetical protein [Nitrospirota bacterium]
MLRNYFLINVLLIILAGFLGFKFYGVLKYSVEMPSGPVAAAVEKEAAPAAADEALNTAQFDVITNSDIFRPSRSAVLPESLMTEKPVPKDPPRVFGTVILENNKTAILEDPDTKTTKTYRVNDSVAGYVITDILEDRVVYSLNGEKVEVRLRESKGVLQQRQTTVSQPVQRPVINRPAINRVPRRVPRPVPPQRNNIPPPPGTPAPSAPDNGTEELDKALEEMGTQNR